MSRHALLIMVGLLACGAASAQVQRSFVASYGNDGSTATNCGLASPCRSFAAAQTVTQSGGEIVALDAAGYGAVTITKSLSILANPGAYAGLSAASGNAILIATAGVVVRLVGLKINGVGADNGIVMTSGSALTLENCAITGFTTFGIYVSAPEARVRILDSMVANNGFDAITLDGVVADMVNTRVFGTGRVGVMADGNSAAPTSVAITNSVSSQNQYGFVSRANGGSGVAVVTVSNSSADHNGSDGFFVLVNDGASATMSVSASKATGNGIGFNNANGMFRSAGNNMVTGNISNAVGTITHIGTM